MDRTSQAQTWLSTLFNKDDLIEIRCIHPTSKTVARQWVKASLAIDNFHWIEDRNSDRDIYVGVHPRHSKGGTNADVRLSAKVFCDIDNIDPGTMVDRIAAAEMPPASMIIATGGGAHAYWLLDEVPDAGKYENIMRRIASAIGGDSIQDAARVMRLPGTMNRKRGGIECRIVDSQPDRIYSIDDLDAALPIGESKPTTAIVHVNGADKLRPSRKTADYLAFGANAGERNNRLLAAACDLAGCGWEEAEATGVLTERAAKDGLDAKEIESAIRSAFSKQRSPSNLPEDTPIVSAMQIMAGESGELATASQDVRRVVAETASAGRPRIANVEDVRQSDENGNERNIEYHIPMPIIERAVSEVSGGWPRRAAGILFVETDRDASDGMPATKNINWMVNVDQLFAWMHKHSDVRWSTGKTVHPKDKTKLNAPTKKEFFEYMKDNAVPAYRAVEMLPHYPPLSDVYYVPCNLPKMDPSEFITPLDQLLDAFNPETDIDRILLKSMILTMGWGGAAGSRPAFILTSDHGRGVGKTTTAEVIADIFGGALSISAAEDWDQVRKRLLSDDALTKRAVLIDNLKTRLEGQDIESILTAKYIDGWKPYHGHASRLNLLTFIITANSPKLSEDIADRGVPIKIGKQKHAVDFRRWAREFLERHRAAIIAEVLAILSGPDQCKIKHHDRWGEWQRGVLAKLAGGDEAAKCTLERRPAMSADREDAEEIAQLIRSMLSSVYGEVPSDKRIFISRKTIKSKLVESQIIEGHFAQNPKAVFSWIRDLVNSGPLHFMRECKSPVGGIRGYVVDLSDGTSTGMEYYPDHFSNDAIV